MIFVPAWLAQRRDVVARLCGAIVIGCVVWLASVREGCGAVWEEFDGYRLAVLGMSGEGRAGFSELPPSLTGITFTNRLAEERSITNQIFLNGSGVAAGDVDGDGLCDLYFCGLDSANALYRNLGGWRFEDITVVSGTGCADQASTGAVFADMDGDLDLDLLVNGIARGTRLFLNDGKGRFSEVTDAFGLRSTHGSASMALADVDGDGYLDLYVVNYRNDTMRDMPDIRFRFGVTNGVSRLLTVDGKPAESPELAGRFTFDQASGVLENGEADVLYRNEGGRRFVAVEWGGGEFRDEDDRPARVPYDWGLSAMFRDLDGDGDPDLYVCNDFQSPDRIWMNDGKGRFRALSRDAIRQTSLFSMGVDVADIDRDGLWDIFVADMLSREHARRQVQVMDATAFGQYRRAAGGRPQYPRNTLFHRRSDGVYAEIAQFAGVEASDWSWCPAFVDVDLDGFEDLLITTGHWRDAQHADVSREMDEAGRRGSLSPIERLRLRKGFPRLDTPNAAFRNRGDLTFEDVSEGWGFASRRISHGLALADLDGDGDLDVAVNCLNDGPLLYRNESARPRVAIRLRGRAPNTRGIGARVKLMAPGLPAQEQEIIAGGRYLSGDDGVRTFAVRDEADRVRLEVRWRGGGRTVLENVPANRSIEVEERAGVVEGVKAEVERAITHFEDATGRLGHRHQDEVFDDFVRQPLLPHKLSESGPGLAWFDFNGDGWDDLIVGAGRGGNLGVYRNDGKGGFVRQRAQFLAAPEPRDVTTVLGWRVGSSDVRLLVGVESYEGSVSNAVALRQVSLSTGAIEEGWLPRGGSVGPLAMADVDADGDLDLFAGGRAKGGRYPESAPSYLMRVERGEGRVDDSMNAVLAGVGLVNGARFSDLDGDGWPELVLACEWGPIRLFKNERGVMRAWDPEIVEPEGGGRLYTVTRFSQLTGWWNSVAAGDFDNDGRMDLVAGNWGRNTSRQRHLGKPLRLFYGAMAGSANAGLVEAHFDAALNGMVPSRDFGALSATFPMLRARYSTYAVFGGAPLEEVLSAGLPGLSEASAATLDSVVLLNRGERFEVRPLPGAAQISPGLGIGVGDLDGDGCEDLFLSQNVFGVSAVESRHDAGRGVWLRGDGRGGFSEVGPEESGIQVVGEGRGVALSDFDGDGRVDVAVGQYRGESRLFRNARGRVGVRVRLEGPGSNPQGIGAVVRLRYRGGKFGAAREVNLGSGYWSQDSAVQVMGRLDEPEGLIIRWPGGRVDEVPVAADAREVEGRWRGAAP